MASSAAQALNLLDQKTGAAANSDTSMEKKPLMPDPDNKVLQERYQANMAQLRLHEGASSALGLRK